MLRKVLKTFDWEYVVRCIAAAGAMYVIATAALHGQPSVEGLGIGR
jgi:hypothetical protein